MDSDDALALILFALVMFVIILTAIFFFSSTPFEAKEDCNVSYPYLAVGIATNNMAVGLMPVMDCVRTNMTKRKPE